MVRRATIAPRKTPRQERSAFTVEAILEAATYILVKQGWQAFTTNAVAERAGVNIASLYQYFPNKESIVVELQRRHIEKGRDALPEIMSAFRRHRNLRALVEAAVREHRIAPALHRVFAEELPRSTRRVAKSHSTEGWHELVEPLLANVPDVDLALFVSRVIAHAAIHEAASERPELLDSPLFVDEIVLLLERYLRRPASDTRAARRTAPAPGQR